MGLLSGYEAGKNMTGVLYGNYSHGNIYYDVIGAIEENKIWVGRDLRKAGVIHEIDQLRIMDVGLGRQALSMSLLGAKEVHHYDISEEHIARFSKLLSDEYPNQSIKTTRTDLCQTALPDACYHFVYLNGIVHHFSDTARGLKNCAGSVRPGGRIWVYFYRSGTFKWFVCQMVRELTDAGEIDSAYLSSALTLDKAGDTHLLTSAVMDDFFAPYIYLYNPFHYIEFMKMLGFEVCSSNDLDPLAEVSHEFLHHSATLVFERVSEVDIGSVDTKELLAPEAEVDQLDPELYSDERPKNCIALFREVKELASTKPDPIALWGLRLRLHEIAAPQYYGESELPPRYDELEQALSLTVNAFRQKNC